MNKEDTFEMKIPTRTRRNMRIRVRADNHLLALKAVARVLRPDLLPIEIRREDGRWRLLSPDGKDVGYIKKING